MQIDICTLFEGDYHIGLSALVNSLISSGYRGTIWAGFRGEVPVWAKASPDFHELQSCLVFGDRVRLRFVPVETQMHLAYFKPRFMLDLLDRHSTADAMTYFDPDIVLKCAWNDLSHWLGTSIAVVGDLNYEFPPRHPKRLAWNGYFEPHGVRAQRALNHYYNSGCLGVSRKHKEFLELWDLLCRIVRDNAGNAFLKNGQANSLFHSGDQDALNFALEATSTVLNTMGPEGMDFGAGGYYLSHAVGPHKPWRGGFTRRALAGVPPSAAAKNFYIHVDGPIAAMSKSAIRLRRLDLIVGSAIGRVYRRS